MSLQVEVCLFPPLRCIYSATTWTADKLPCELLNKLLIAPSQKKNAGGGGLWENNRSGEIRKTPNHWWGGDVSAKAGEEITALLFYSFWGVKDRWGAEYFLIHSEEDSTRLCAGEWDRFYCHAAGELRCCRLQGNPPFAVMVLCLFFPVDWSTSPSLWILKAGCSWLDCYRSSSRSWFESSPELVQYGNLQQPHRH